MKNLFTTKLIPISLTLVFFGPLIVAWLLANHGQDYIPVGKAAKGELIVPAKPIAGFNISGIKGNTISNNVFHGKWTFVTTSTRECDIHCQDNLYKMRQVRLTQGKNVDRIQRLIILENYSNLDNFSKILGDHAGLIVGIENDAQQGLSTQLKQVSNGESIENRIFIVDPLGNIFMRYTSDADATFMRKDITKVLAHSRIG